MTQTGMPVWEAETLGENLARAGVTRREFLEFCGRMATIFAAGSPLLGLASPRTADAAEEIARRLSAVRKPNVVWLQLQECTGCLESTLRSGPTTVEDLILNLVSVNYVELLMAAAGSAAGASLARTNAEPHLLVVNGSIPLGAGGAYTVIGGRSAKSVLEESAENATHILAVGACAVWGSVQASRPNPTGAVGVDEIITDRPVVNVAGCPPIGDVITATITYVLTYGQTPPVDEQGRPLFAYGQRIHDGCPRRAHFDAGQYVTTFDDDAAHAGWCLYHMGCKGPDTFSPCPAIKWNLGTSFPIDAGHPCIGCTEEQFFDRYTPFYSVLPEADIVGIPVEGTANEIGRDLLAVTMVGIGAHASATAGRRWFDRRNARAQEPLAAFGDASPEDGPAQAGAPPASGPEAEPPPGHEDPGAP